MKTFYAICMSLLLTVAPAMAQMTVTGTVTAAEDGSPLPGVSIVVEGTTQGTISDIDGRYRIEVSPSAVLQFSFVGYKTQQQKAQSVLNVVMETDAIMMDEVVSLGYTSAKKAELSSAAVSVSADELTDVTTSDIGQMLQGKVAGVQVSAASGQPGSEAQIRVRGTGSITATNNPLYVVDGVPGGSFNPNDVESITVLKDAGATAIYGAGAAGGVIIVTTKSGKGKQGKVNVDFKLTGGLKQALFGNMKMMDSRELYYFQKTLYSKTTFNIIRPKSLLEQDYNWLEGFFKLGATQDYYVSVSGAGEKVKYFASVDYYNEDGTLKSTDFDRVSASFNLEAELCKGLTLDLRANFFNSNANEASSWTILNDAYYKLPWDNPYDADGNLEKITGSKRADGSVWYSQDQWNSLHSIQYDFARNNTFAFHADAALHWQATDWLSFHSVNRFSRSASKYTLYYDPRSYNSTYSKGYLGITNTMGKSFSTTNTVKAGYTWTRHTLNGIVGYEYAYSQNEYNSAEGTGMPENMPDLDACQKLNVGGYSIPEKSWSAFVQVQYDYAKRYFLTASFRADASSLFGSKHRVGYFPSVAASWMLTNESWLKDQDVMNMMKLRASYGLTGNNQIAPYQYLSVYAFGSKYQDNVGAYLERLSNEELRWETAYMATVGLDFEFLKGRIGFSIDLYNTDNKDLLLNVPLAPSMGFASIMQNRGSVRNQGIELQWNSANVIVGGFRWDMGFNISFNRNRVMDLPNHESFLQTASNVSQIVQEGEDIYSWYMPKWLGVDPENGDPLWEKINYDANGNEIGREPTNNYNEAQSQIVGKATPICSGGWLNTFSWKGLSLAVNCMYNVGGTIFNFTREAIDSDGAYVGHNQMSMLNNKQGWSRWENPGDIATHPKAVLNGNKQSNQLSSRYLEDGSYFRIKNITLAYSLQPDVLAKAHMTHCKFYFSADNVATATKFSGMDPEVNMVTTSDALAGFYATEYPSSRQFLIGVEIGF